MMIRILLIVNCLLGCTQVWGQYAPTDYPPIYDPPMLQQPYQMAQALEGATFHPLPAPPPVPQLPPPQQYRPVPQLQPPVQYQVPPTYEPPSDLPPPASPEPVTPEAVEVVTAEPEPVYYWYYPHYWFPKPWEGSFQLGMNGSEGNADAFSFRTGADLKKKTETHIIALDMTYAQTTARGVTTQDNALLNTRYDHLFGDSPWTLFAKANLEYDEFKAFDIRLVSNIGVGYQFWETTHTNLAGRFGSGFSREIGGPDDSIVPEAVFGLDYDIQLSDRQKLYAKMDYFPEWGEFGNFRAVLDSGWEIVLDEATNLSLKIGIIDRYDSTPNGLRRNDLDYSFLLLWKL